MKTLGEEAIDLPWIAPSVAALTALARSPLPSVWPSLRSDPGILLLVARSMGTGSIHGITSEQDIPLLESILRHLPHFHTAAVDWNQPGPDFVYRICYQQALLAQRLAEKTDCDEQHAWIAGFLAPLGWLAITVADPRRSTQDLAHLQTQNDTSEWQQLSWGHDHTAIARRLGRYWRLPVWLTAIIGHLGLHVNIVERLGAPVKIFQVVQLAVHLIQERQRGLRLPVGSTQSELLAALQLSIDDVTALTEEVLHSEIPRQNWEAPSQHLLLPDFLRLALENRHRKDEAWIERLQQDLDRLQDALIRQSTEDHERLHTLKLAAMAEFAAGAGHEINNPLAVISGQAQYLLKQLEWLDGPAEEIENIGEYLENLRAMLTPALQKIIGQTQRVHTILTDLMQFARPGIPRQQSISINQLVREVIDSLQASADEHQVQILHSEIDPDVIIHADSAQVRVALSGLLRNAIEAAPAEGRASVRMLLLGNHTIDLLIEDNGEGPPPSVREHLFDPFFCGRSAGRGRGMGLPTAWRLARQQGGDVRFEGVFQGLTRFVLSLPLPPAVQPPHHSNGNGHPLEKLVRNGLQLPLERHR